MDSLKVTDDESKAVQKTPHRVALADIEAAISAEHTFRLSQATHALQMPGMESHDVMTLCVITMRNGFVVIGKAAPADPANFNPELGRKFAREDAIRQLWPHMGFALRDRLYREQDKQPGQELDFRTGKPYPERDKPPG